MRTRPHAAMISEKYRSGMLAVADRLCVEFPHLPLLDVARAMNDVRRECDAADPDPETVYRLARPRLTQLVTQ